MVAGAQTEMLPAFSETYFEARAKFRAACQAQGVDVEILYHPAPGPAGEHLTTDVARFGDPQASRLLIVNSGTHGVEGLAGSGCQISALHEGLTRDLPADTAVLMVHMINPWGAAWRRRQTDGNVDLNRNFLDFAGDLPGNAAYEDLRAVLSDPAEDLAVLERFRQDRGEAAYGEALFRGQYSDPHGVGFGGHEPTWSSRSVREILASHAGAARHVCFIDLHTGLGEFGKGILIDTTAGDGAEVRRARDWFGEVVAINTDDNPLPYQIVGDMCTAVRTTLGKAAAVTLALEFGTYDIERFAALQMRDSRLEQSGQVASAAGQALRAEVQEFFYPDSADWRAMIRTRALDVLATAVVRLAAL